MNIVNASIVICSAILFVVYFNRLGGMSYRENGVKIVLQNSFLASACLYSAYTNYASGFNLLQGFIIVMAALYLINNLHRRRRIDARHMAYPHGGIWRDS